MLFVHDLGHGAWCWEHRLDAAAAAGYPAYAVSLRGYFASPGRLRTARPSHYVDDVVGTAVWLQGGPAVLVGHSVGGLVVQQTVARRAARRYDARLEEFLGTGHDLLLDARWQEPPTTMPSWLENPSMPR